MQLSVVIVNYNVCYFLEQCLFSLQRALAGISSEIIVVDNASSDNSKSYLPQKFPRIRFIWKDTNAGFARANNEGVALASGEYVLILNPDTLLPEDCLQTALAFIRSHPDAGAIGMRMYDGRFRYLPESKRGLPDLPSAFFKLSGLIKRFPRNKWIAHYYQGHLSPDSVQQIDVLAGAFMLLSRQVYLEVGGFDERYFMYGEDIDLSFSLTRAGYRNYYLPNPGILHFKGESTVRTAANARHFYEAMLVFRTKYGQKSSWFSKGMVEVAIWLRVLKEKLRGRVTPSVTAARPKNSYAICSSIETYNPAHPSLFLLGDQLLPGDLFRLFQKFPPKAPIRFSWIGTAAAVGSDNPDERGEIIPE